MATIYTRVESPRGCGYRKKGGMYIVSDGIGKPCCRLPQELTICPCCGEGIKQNRGFSWVSGALFTTRTTGYESCTGCALNNVKDRQFALMWVGEKFYKSTLEFTREAMTRGVSKRIAMIPHKLKIGETWVLLAHPRAIQKLKPLEDEFGAVEYTPGIFQAFKPSRIEYIITGEETPDELADLERRGLTLINVVRDIDTQSKLV